VPVRQKRAITEDDVLAATLTQLRDAFSRGDRGKLLRLKAVIDERGWVQQPTKRVKPLAITYLSKPDASKEVVTAAALTKARKQAPLAIEDIPRPVSSTDGPEPAPREGVFEKEAVQVPEGTRTRMRSGRATKNMPMARPARATVKSAMKPKPTTQLAITAQEAKKADIPEPVVQAARRSGRSGGSRVK
jgi:hypothetical protein